MFHINREQHGQQQSVALKEFTQKDTAYDIINTDNEYESLDKYTQPGEYEEIEFPSKQVSGSVQQKQPRLAGNCKVTQCPAYIPITRKVASEFHTSGSGQLNVGGLNGDRR